VLIQGVMLAHRTREQFGSVNLTETHPKVLIQALRLEDDWRTTARRFELSGPEPNDDHQRDAILSAVAAREGFSRRWRRDLTIDRDTGELEPARMWFGPVNYWWPE
jgi:hypothetical protein